MASLLLSIIYVAFISLGLPDSLLGAAWPSMYGGACLMPPFFGVLADHLSPALFPFYLLVLLRFHPVSTIVKAGTEQEEAI